MECIIYNRYQKRRAGTELLRAQHLALKEASDQNNKILRLLL